MIAKARLLILCGCITIIGLISSITIGPFYHIVLWREKFDEIIEYRIIPKDESLKPFIINKTQADHSHEKSNICIITTFIQPKYQGYMITYTVIMVVFGTFALPFGLKLMSYGTYLFRIQMTGLMIINYLYIICLNMYYLTVFDPTINNYKLCGDDNNLYHKNFYKYGIRMIYGMFISGPLFIWRFVLIIFYCLERKKTMAEITRDIPNEADLEKDITEMNNISNGRINNQRRQQQQQQPSASAVNGNFRVINTDNSISPPPSYESVVNEK